MSHLSRMALLLAVVAAVVGACGGEDASFDQVVHLKAPLPYEEYGFGGDVALSGDTLAVGTDVSEVHVFRRAGATWEREGVLAGHRSFGYTLALDGDTLVIGAPFIDDLADPSYSGWDIGAVYVFRRTGSTWEPEASFQASNLGRGDEFGTSVALSGDTLAVGAYREDSAATGVNGNQDDDSIPDSGAVYVFRRTGTVWQQEAYLKASNTGDNDRFGTGLALLGDTLAVGAPGESSQATGMDGDQADERAFASGAVYIFRRTGPDWVQGAYIKASNTNSGDSFGASLALSGDTLAVGASSEDSAATGINGDQADNSMEDSGAVYVFRRKGTAWQQEAYIKASNTGGGRTFIGVAPGDQFGGRVALSGDILAVAAQWEDSAATGVGGNQADDSVLESGAAYVFRREGAAWYQDAYVKSFSPKTLGLFGNALALSRDTFVVGAGNERGGGERSTSSSDAARQVARRRATIDGQSASKSWLALVTRATRSAQRCSLARSLHAAIRAAASASTAMPRARAGTGGASFALLLARARRGACALLMRP